MKKNCTSVVENTVDQKPHSVLDLDSINFSTKLILFQKNTNPTQVFL